MRRSVALLLGALSVVVGCSLPDVPDGGADAGSAVKEAVVRASTPNGSGWRLADLPLCEEEPDRLVWYINSSALESGAGEVTGVIEAVSATSIVVRLNDSLHEIPYQEPPETTFRWPPVGTSVRFVRRACWVETVGESQDYVEMRLLDGELVFETGRMACESTLLRPRPDLAREPCSLLHGARECCCGTLSTFPTEVLADEPLMLEAGESRRVAIGGKPVFVRVGLARMAKLGPCGTDGEGWIFSGGAVAAE